MFNTALKIEITYVHWHTQWPYTQIETDPKHLQNKKLKSYNLKEKSN